MRVRQRWGRCAAAMVAILACGTVALTGCEPPPDTYVSLGDSNVAGPLVPNQVLSPLACLRSDHNFPNLMKGWIKASRMVDVSCSGATTDSIVGSQTLPDGTVLPPQVDQVNSRTKIVTLGIGGNDIGFAEIVTTCATKMAMLSPCAPVWVHDGRDEISERINALGPRLDRTFSAIEQRAPQAKVFIIGYLPMLPDGYGCAPLSPLPQDLPWLRAKRSELNAKLRDRARAAGLTFVEGVDTAVGHDMCQAPGAKWVEGLLPTAVAAPFHANADGHQGLAHIIAAAINAKVTS